MKIGIITLLGNNYGNRLQNYAVQELLRPYGEVRTIRCEPKPVAAPARKKWRRLTPGHIVNAVNSRLLNIYHISDRRRILPGRVLRFLKTQGRLKTALSARSLAFQRFDETYIQYEPELLHLTGDDNAAWVNAYDAWICGSDQIWNPTYPTATRNAFLQFAPSQRRISLSASIGISETDQIPSEHAAWISEIPYLSVREQRAAEMIQTLTGRHPEVFLDPTMLLPRSHWDSMASAARMQLPEKYAFSYFLGIREKSYQQYIARQLQERQLQHVDLLNGEAPDQLSYAPDQFVAAIRGAEVVFTDSFHGAVFALLYHKPFVVFERVEEGRSMNSRLQTLLNRFGLENRMYRPHQEPEWERPLDGSAIDDILTSERLRVHSFLNHAMSRIAELPKAQASQHKRLRLTHPAQCTGCTACSQRCPVQCISMQADPEGFLYPHINESACLDCGLCEQICPVRHRVGSCLPMAVLAEKNRDESIRRSSSSGGVFYELAANTLRRNGVVFGCALDECMVARHIRVDDMERLPLLQSSKYVQSDMNGVMREVRQLLEQGKNVLFSGTPCQVAGLRNFLGKDYQNLILVDVLCHGVPSPKLFADYLSVLSADYGTGKPVSVNFRSKQRGWKRLYMEVCFDNGKRHYIFSGYDRYESLFLNNKSLRPSCHECKFASAERFGDITLGDFWGIGRKHPHWDDDKGISAVMLNTENGQAAWEQIRDQFDGLTEEFDILKAGQRTLYAPSPKHPQRDAFYQLYAEKGIKAALEAHTHVPGPVVRGYYAIMRWGLDHLRALLGRGF